MDLKLNTEQIEFDENGRVVITNKDICDKIKKIREADRKISINICQSDDEPITTHSDCSLTGGKLTISVKSDEPVTINSGCSLTGGKLSNTKDEPVTTDSECSLTGG